MKEACLNIVDEDDNIIGIKTRKEIHDEGLLHREINVYFITKNKEIVFQHRAKDKDTCPDLLESTVGGHVEIGDSYQETAVKEIEEETGLKINPEDLVFLKKDCKKPFYDPKTSKTNHAWRENYLYYFKGELSDLKIEEGKAIGFESYSLEKIQKMSEAEKSRFVPSVLDFVLSNLDN